jgi:alpha-tubulin suppressor-like RCC1 family protein
MFMKENPENEIIRIDCADEYTGALTKSGDLYVWGKNNQGQLGIGTGIGIDATESEKTPTLVIKPEQDFKVVDFSCGENGMILETDKGLLYKTGWRIDYIPTLFEITKTVKPKTFFCGNSYYCMIGGKILYYLENNKIYQWGNLFPSNMTIKTDADMQEVKSEGLFNNREIIAISAKFKLAGAIVKH